MAKIYINDFAYANCAAVPFMIIAQRFIRHDLVFDFIVKFMTMIFSMLPELEKKKEIKPIDEKKGKKQVLVGKLAEEQKAKEQEEQLAETNRFLKKVRLIEILKKI